MIQGVERFSQMWDDQSKAASPVTEEEMKENCLWGVKTEICVIYLVVLTRLFQSWEKRDYTQAYIVFVPILYHTLFTLYSTPLHGVEYHRA